MGNEHVERRFENCLKNHNLVEIQCDKDFLKTEVDAADKDLKAIKIMMKEKLWKQSIHSAYYVVFQLARALVCKQGFREKKSHYCLGVALEHLYAKQVNFSRIFKTLQGLREEADYDNNYSKDSADFALSKALEFRKMAKSVLKM